MLSEGCCQGGHSTVDGRRRQGGRRKGWTDLLAAVTFKEFYPRFVQASGF